jgi:subtilase family serine protease
MNPRGTMRAALSVALASALLAGCGGGHAGSTPASGGGALPPAAPVQQNLSFAYNTQTLRNAQLVGPAQLKRISVDAVPRLRDANGLLTFAQQVGDPKSGQYRHFLTPTEIADRFGASAGDYKAAIAYFKSKGLTVDSWPQRMLLHVSGAQADMEAAFGTHFGWYKNQSGTFLAPMSAPKMPDGVPVIGSPDIVQAVGAFSDIYHIKSNAQNDGMMYGYSPQQIAAAFDYNGAYHAGYTGAGITVGVIGTGPFSSGDVPAYKALYHVPGSGTATMVSATDAESPGNGATGFATPPPVTAPCMGNPIMPRPGCNPEDGEAQLDTEQIASLAYDSNLHYYLAYNPNDGCGAIGTECPPGTGIPLQGLGEIDAELQTAIAENASDVLSLSFGGPEAALVGMVFNSSGNGFEPLEFAALASEGIAVFVSSGDAGAEECQRPFYQPAADNACVSYPSTDPNVVAVGGTNTPLDSAGRFIGPLTGWGNKTTYGFAGSGGGVSQYFQLSSYQRGAAGITGSMRNVPDIALEGDANTGVAMLMYGDPSLGGPFFQAVGGTSVAAPEAAAMWALVLQACSRQASCSTATGAHPYRMGNPAALFYKIYGDSSAYKSTFYDVLYGDNSQQNSCWLTGPTPPPDPNATPGPCPTQLDPGFQAGPGYDMVTGVGVPFARSLIHAVVGV